MTITLALILCLLCGLLDWVRGGKVGGLPVAALNGFLLSLFLVPISGWSALIALVFAAGSAPGWGQPMGVIVSGDKPTPDTGYEWWQFGWLKTNPTLALAVRGLMWFPTMTIAFPAATWLSRLLPIAPVKRWRASEFIRGVLNAVLVAGIHPFL